MSVNLRSRLEIEAGKLARKMPRQERSRALVDAILEAGTRILARQGREAVSTNNLAAVAGVSIGSFYQYFPNREAVIAAVAQRHAQQIYDCIMSVDVAGVSTLERAVVDIVDALFASHFLEPELHIALVHDLEPPISTRGDVAPLSGAKPAVVSQLMRLPQHFDDCAPAVDLACAAFVIAEMTHALAHVAINRNCHTYSTNELKSEAIRVTMSYLRQAPNKYEQIFAFEQRNASILSGNL